MFRFWNLFFNITKSKKLQWIKPFKVKPSSQDDLVAHATTNGVLFLIHELEKNQGYKELTELKIVSKNLVTRIASSF